MDMLNREIRVEVYYRLKKLTSVLSTEFKKMVANVKLRYPFILKPIIKKRIKTLKIIVIIIIRKVL